MEIKHPVFHHTEENEKIYGEYASLSPIKRLETAFDRDSESGEYRFDRILSRRGELHGDPNHGGNDDGDALMTRGRALYMFTHDPAVIGFGGSPSYCQPLEREYLMALTLSINGETVDLTENKDERVNAPSHWHSVYECDALTLTLDKYISEENCAVALYKIENRKETAEVTVTAKSPFASERWAIYPDNVEQGELRSRFPSRDALTTITARMTLSCAPRPHHDEDALTSRVTLANGETATGYAIISFTTVENPKSESDYLRFAAECHDIKSALAEQTRIYNEYWHKNVPYIDTPSPSVNKAVDYRHWLERYNVLDANIPGYDYQYPVTMEGVLGYNNAIVLTQCMHLEDTKWLRSPRLPYGQLLSVGACSGGSAFLDNPGNRRCWNNHYGQYIAAAGRDAFYVHGGDKKLALALAHFFECDAKGQFEHYGNHESKSMPKSHLIAYRSNYMTGNDADTVSMHYRGVGKYKIHAENAYVYGAASASSEMYALAGEGEKSREMKELAEAIRADILHYLWCDKCRAFETLAVEPGEGFVVHNPDMPNLVPLKECNNYNYFAMRVPPTDEKSLKKYRPALRHLADPEEFPIFPYYTASQRDNKIAPGSNNFSNINYTVQAHAYEAALRTYDRDHEYVTPEMLSTMTEWCAWNMYPDGGDVRYPNNSEFFNADRASDPCGKGDYYRSWIYHNILGNYIYVFIEDMAGLRPRADGKIELDPIDFGYGHFTADNMRYHGRDVTVIYNSDGAYDVHDIKRGYSLYIDGELAVCTDKLAHVVYDPETGKIDTDANVVFARAVGALPCALDASLDTPTTELLRLSGLTGENLALSATVTATYTPEKARAALWAEKHRADGSDPTSLATNECVPSPNAVVDGVSSAMPFWSDIGSPNENDSLTLTFATPVTIDTLAIHFYDDRQDGGVSYPRRYGIEYRDGGEWRLVTTRSQTPRYMTANRNESRFDAVTTDAVRVTFEDRAGHSVAVTEIQLFYEGTPRRAVINHSPLLFAHSHDIGGLRAALSVEIVDDGMPFDKSPSCRWSVDGKPDGAVAEIEDAGNPETVMTVSTPGRYYVTLHATDGEIRRHISHFVDIAEPGEGAFDYAPSAKVNVDFCTDWENKDGVNNASFEPTSSNMGTGLGWGTWGSREKSHSLTLEWDEKVPLSAVDVYWYADEGGIRLPRSYSLEYDGGDGFVPLAYKSGTIEADAYNRASFETVLAQKLRVNVECGQGAVGIYRLKAYAPHIASISDTTVAVKTGNISTLPATVTAYTDDGDAVSLHADWLMSSVDTSSDGVYTVHGISSPIPFSITATVYARGDMDSAVITSADNVTVNVRAGKSPSLPEFATVHYNNGAADNTTHKIEWSDEAKKPRTESVTLADAGRAGDLSVALTVNVINKSK